MSLAPHEPFELEKTIWTEADFDQMGWHDVHIHAIAFRPDDYELLLDIDYLFEWIEPKKKGGRFSFRMSPCTLVFTNVHGFIAEIDNGLGLEIDIVERVKVGRPRNADYVKKESEWRWVFNCQEGEFSFISVGYRQFTRKKPITAKVQKLNWDSRGGICFDRTTYDNDEGEQGAAPKP